MSDRDRPDAAAPHTPADGERPVRTQRVFDPKTKKVSTFQVRSIQHRFRRLRNREILDRYDRPGAETPETPLTSLGLAPGIRKILEGHGIRTAEELAERAETGALTDFNGIGEGAEQAIREALAKAGGSVGPTANAGETERKGTDQPDTDKTGQQQATKAGQDKPPKSK